MMGNKKIFVSLGMILLLVIVTIGVTFAAFTFTKEGQVENTLETSTIMLTYTEGKTGIMLNEAYPMSDEKGKILTGENNVFDFTVQATLGKSTIIGYEVTAVKIPITDMEPLEDNEVKLYLERAIDPNTTYEEVFAPNNFIPRDKQTEIGSPIGSMVLDAANFTDEGTTINHYRLRMWVDEKANIPSGETRKYGVKINVYAKQGISAIPKETNKNILNIYAYNQEKGSSTFCVTGEESTCVELTTPPSTYEAGTIIKYKVNATEEKYFHVMFDEGDTLTLQHRENTVENTEWYEENTSRKGPLTILPALENATSDWTNVLEQTYTLGTTVFKDNAFTSCSNHTSDSCTSNYYTLAERTAKARMISIQETYHLGCTLDANSCPVWMYNYLVNSITFGGTVNQGVDWAYWTNSAQLEHNQIVFRVFQTGKMTTNNGYATEHPNGARAVITISKWI